MGLDLLKLLVLISKLVLDIAGVSEIRGVLEVGVVVRNFASRSVRDVTEIFDHIHACQNLTTVGRHLEGAVTLSLLLSIVVENTAEAAYELLEPRNHVEVGASSVLVVADPLDGLVHGVILILSCFFFQLVFRLAFLTFLLAFLRFLAGLAFLARLSASSWRLFLDGLAFDVYRRIVVLVHNLGFLDGPSVLF